MIILYAKVNWSSVYGLLLQETNRNDKWAAECVSVRVDVLGVSFHVSDGHVSVTYLNLIYHNQVYRLPFTTLYW